MKGLGTYRNKLWLLTPLKKFWEIRDPKTVNKWHQKFQVGLFTGHLTGIFTLLWRSLTGVSLSLFHMIPMSSLMGNVVSIHWKNYGILKNTVISHILKGTLMQIWKSLRMFVFIENWYPENFAFWILRIHELFIRKVCIFLKKYATFKHILLFLYIYKQTFCILYSLLLCMKLFLCEDKCIARFFIFALVYL